MVSFLKIQAEYTLEPEYMVFKICELNRTKYSIRYKVSLARLSEMIVTLLNTDW
jgi:hypothetical protein